MCYGIQSSMSISVTNKIWSYHKVILYIPEQCRISFMNFTSWLWPFSCFCFVFLLLLLFFIFMNRMWCDFVHSSDFSHGKNEKKIKCLLQNFWTSLLFLIQHKYFNVLPWNVIILDPTPIKNNEKKKAQTPEICIQVTNPSFFQVGVVSVTNLI